eukprot:TRINITY_DN14723_c0_g2_i1.p1 TRINITY_DN14723_c0_g2~~TRINITY_DN14723_c0_g2_i1.p1  ORF type:complete len:105 (+),score=20.27 TRINITY_DN14723_c0_g2_i1:233-547(+)
MGNSKAMTSAQFQLIFIFVAVTAVASGDGVAARFLAKQNQTQEAQQLMSATPMLHARNDASSTVHLMSCMQISSSVTVVPGGTRNIRLSELSGVWLVPDVVMLD